MEQLFFRSVCALVAIYGVMMFAAGRWATWAYDALGFGPGALGLSAPQAAYVSFAFGTLGAVVMAWSTMMALLPLDDRRVIRAVAIGFGSWFVADTGFSLIVGMWTHALFNVPFFVALAFPLRRMHRDLLAQ